MKYAPRFVPLVLRFGYGQTKPEVRDEELKMLRQFKNCRLVLSPNHPDRADPAVVTLVAAQAGLKRRFILANRTQFDGLRGIKGRLMQSQGAYSIARGTVDRASFKCTRELLTDLEYANQLLIYPEGGNYSRTDSVFPFLSGVFGLILKAQEDLMGKLKSKDAERVITNEEGAIFVVPMALKYVVDDPMVEEKIQAAICSLEKYVGIENGTGAERFDRVIRLSEAILAQVEAHEQLPILEFASPFERLERIQLCLLQKVEARLGFYDTPKQQQDQVQLSIPDRTRKAIEAFLRISDEDFVPSTGYEQTLLKRDLKSAENLRAELSRLQNWIDVRPGYLRDQLADNRIVDTIMRFELEIFGSVRLRVQRTCVVRIGRPIDARLFATSTANAKKADKRQRVLDFTQAAEDSVRSMLEEMSEVENVSPANLQPVG